MRFLRQYQRIAMPCIVLLALFVLFAATDSRAATRKWVSSIELADGTTHTDIYVLVDKTYKTVTLELPDNNQNVSFTKIVALLDENGDDVTVDWLGGDYRPEPPAKITRRPVSGAATDPEQTPPEEAPASTNAAAPDSWPTTVDHTPAATVPSRRSTPFSFGVHVSGCYSFPIGDWFEGHKSGVGFGADFVVPINHELALRGTVSKSGLQDDLDKFFTVPVLRDDVSASVTRYYLSIQYYDWPRWSRGGKVMYYAFTGLGAVSHSASGTAVIRDPLAGEEYLVGWDGSSITKFSVVSGIGLVHMISRTTGIDVGMTSDILFIGGGEENAGIERALIIDIKLALVQLF